MSKARRERRLAQKERSRPGKIETPRGPGALRFVKRREWIALGIILLFGLVLRFVYLAEIRGAPAFEYPAFDAAFHDHWARCLITGDWSPPEFHSDPKIHETAFFRPPGYPYFLAGVYLLTGKSYVAARVIQMLIGLVSCVLAFSLARSMFGSVVGLITAGLMAVYWGFIYFEGELLAPVLLVFFALLMMHVLARWLDGTTWVNTIAAGWLLGLFALIRPNALVLVPVALIWIWWIARRRKDPRRWRVALLGFPLGVVLAIAPVTIRNYTVASDFVPITSNAGVNFYIGNNEHTDCVSANVPILGQITTLGSWTCFDQPAIVAAVEQIVGRPLKASEVSQFFSDKAMAHITANPGKTIELMWRKGFLFWGPTEISNNKVIHFDRAHSNVLRFAPGFPLALALAVVGLLLLFIDYRSGRQIEDIVASRTGVMSGRKPNGDKALRFEIMVLVIGFVVAYFASYLPFFVAGRYRVPIIPFLLMFGAYGIDRVRTMVTARQMKHAAIWLGVLVVAYLATTRQIADYQPDIGMWHFDRGDAYRKQGNTALAQDEFRMAVESSDDPNPITLNNLGAALDQMGRPDEAVEYFEKALEVKPNYLEARQNLVSVLLRMNNAAAAAEHLAEIVRVNPNDASARFNLGVCLLRQDKMEGGIAQLQKAISLNPNHVYAQYYLAKALALSGRTLDAINRYQVVVRLAADHAAARFELATLLVEVGRNEEAVTHLTRVLQLKPDHAEARRMLDELGK